MIIATKHTLVTNIVTNHRNLPFSIYGPRCFHKAGLYRKGTQPSTKPQCLDCQANAWTWTQEAKTSIRTTTNRKLQRIWFEHLTLYPAPEIPPTSGKHLQRQTFQVLALLLYKILLFLFRQLRAKSGPVYPSEDNLQTRVRKGSIKSCIILG